MAEELSPHSWLISLEFHDDAFSRDTVVINVAQIPGCDLPLGSLARVAPFHAAKSQVPNGSSGGGSGPARQVSDQLSASDSRSTHRSDGTESEVSRRTKGSSSRGGGRKRTGTRGLDSDSSPGTMDHARSVVFRITEPTPEQAAKKPNLQISLHASVKTAFHLSNRQQAVVYAADPEGSKAAFVELAFRDQYLSRADMWQLAVAELANRSVFRGQQVLFLGSVKARIKNIFVGGRKVDSALATPATVPIFRSESAKYVFFIQMSREMWEYDAEGSGEIMFNKVINGFLPDLFKRWQRAGVRHLVSIVMFSRIEYEKGILKHNEENGKGRGERLDSKGSKDYRDFYRVVTTDMASAEWIQILYALKKEFKVFLRDTLILPGTEAYGRLPDTLADVREASEIDCVIAGRPTIAAKGNVLECINLASSQFAQDYMDRDLIRTGISLVIISGGTGVFEVDYRLLKLTTDTLVGNGIGIDLVALAPMPLHSVPLFRYRTPKATSTTFPKPYYGSLDRVGSTPRNMSMHQMPTSSPDKSRHMFPNPSEPESPGSASPETEWSFAMPHWVDVSFWTGEVSDFSWEDSNTVTRTRGHGSKNGFMSTCRMYELQMMGLMEIEMSDIAIRFLNPYIDQSISIPSRPKLPTKNSNMSVRMLTPTGSPEKRTHEIDDETLKTRELLFKWMDQYEGRTFQEKTSVKKRALPNATTSSNISKDDQKPRRPGSRNATGSELARSPNISLISRSPHGGYRGLNGGRERQDSTASMSDTASIQNENMLSRKVSNTSKFDSPKRAKIGRNISLGFKGLGPAKAIASTSLSSAGAEFTSAVATEPQSKPQPAKQSGLLTQQLRNTLRKKPSQQTLSEDSMSVKSDDKAPTQLHSNPISIQKDSSSESATTDEDSLGKTVRPVKGLLKPSEYGSTVRPDSSHMQAAAAGKSSLSKSQNSRITGHSPAMLTSPWLTLLNPSNPRKDNMSLANQFRRWQHVFPRAVSTAVIKWKSLTSPAALPLTSEYFPSYEELRDEFEESTHAVHIPRSDDAGIRPNGARALMRQLLAARLSNGFQIVVGPDAEGYAELLGLKLLDCFKADLDADRDHIVLLSVGDDYHQLQCIEEDEVIVKRFEKKMPGHIEDHSSLTIDYRPRIRTMLAETYERRRFVLRNPRSTYDWSLIDGHAAGGQGDLLHELRYWRARFVLIPVEIPKSARGPLAPVTEVSDEETRLEGIQKLTQMWQRHRYFQPGEKRIHASVQLRAKDANPLAIDYQTRDPSAVVRTHAAGTVDSLLHGWNHAQLFAEAELYHSTDFDPHKLAQHFQARPPRGITIVDRRWHWKVYHRCFRGDEFTTWLLANFRDVETREDAVKLGNELMRKGLINHAVSKHPFRDGNYFYQVGTEYRTANSTDGRLGWFGRMTDRSVPNTPRIDSNKNSPLIERPDSRQSGDESSGSSSGDRTPTRERSIELSRMLQYDVDPRGKSWRPEIIHLHYDRLHNPENCYHIRVDWMNVTSKLIEDAIVSWAASAERYGLRLVEVPIGEASKITNQHPFRAPYTIELAVQPPRSVPRSSYDSAASHTHAQEEHFPYHKALLRKWDFVLDLEAAQSFEGTVPVTYSWGKPDYQYTQFIHKTGTLIAQIDDDGNILLLMNKLASNRVISAVREAGKFDTHDRQPPAFERRMPRSTPIGSPSSRPADSPLPTNNSPHLNPKPPAASRHHTATSKRDLTGSKAISILEARLAGRPPTPKNIKDVFERFCHSRAELEAFYETALRPSAAPSPRLNPGSPRVTPLLRGVSSAASARHGPATHTEDIPTLGLPEKRVQLAAAGRASSYATTSVGVQDEGERDKDKRSIAQLFGGRAESPRESGDGTQRRGSGQG